MFHLMQLIRNRVGFGCISNIINCIETSKTFKILILPANLWLYAQKCKIYSIVGLWMNSALKKAGSNHISKWNVQVHIDIHLQNNESFWLFFNPNKWDEMMRTNTTWPIQIRMHRAHTWHTFMPYPTRQAFADYMQCNHITVIKIAFIRKILVKAGSWL